MPRDDGLSEDQRRFSQGKALSPTEEFVWMLHQEHPEMTAQELCDLAESEHQKPMAVRGMRNLIGRVRRKKGLKHRPVELKRKVSKRRELLELKEVKKEVLEAKVSNIADRFADSILALSDHAIDQLTIHERIKVLNVSIEKRQLLRGEPTQIHDVRDSRRLEEVGAALLQELQRRGMEVDVTPQTSEWAAVVPKAAEGR